MIRKSRIEEIRNGNGPISLDTLGMFTVVFAVLFLGTSSLLIKLSEIQPIATAFYRMVFALPIFYLWMQKESHKPVLSLPVIRKLLVAGFFFAFDLALWHSSFSYTSVANATLFACLLPFIVIPIRYFFFDEHMNKTFFLGAFTALMGILLLLKGKVNPSLTQFYGDGLAFTGAFFYALYLITISPLRDQCSLAQVMFWNTFGTVFVLGIASCLFETKVFPTSLPGLGVLLGLALTAQVGGQGLLAYALGLITPSFVSLMILLQPPTAAFFAYLFLDESLSWLEIGGMFVTLIGVVLAKMRKPSRNQR